MPAILYLGLVVGGGEDISIAKKSIKLDHKRDSFHSRDNECLYPAHTSF